MHSTRRRLPPGSRRYVADFLFYCFYTRVGAHQKYRFGGSEPVLNLNQTWLYLDLKSGPRFSKSSEQVQFRVQEFP
jgi:hypothetical protein